MLRKLYKSAIIEILKLLKETGGLNPSALEKELVSNIGVSTSTVYNRINTLAELGIIDFDFGVSEKGRPIKICRLTPLGQKIVSLIEQMEKEFEEYHRKESLPEDPEEFINELLEE